MLIAFQEFKIIIENEIGIKIQTFLGQTMEVNITS
jgi:hypothetical protein